MVGETFWRYAIIIIYLFPIKFKINHGLKREVENIIILQYSKILHRRELIVTRWIEIGKLLNNIARRPFAVAVFDVHAVVDAQLGEVWRDGRD